MDILVVEDELSLRDGLRDLLTGAGHVVEVAADGRTAVELGLARAFDVVVLDLMLPRLDGVEVCRRLRAARPGLAILMLTARQSLDDKVRGLGEGADDYMTKPFAARELLARVAALGRRHLGGKDAERIELDGVAIDLSILEIRHDGGQVSLTAREAGILRALYRNRGRAVSRAELLETVWGARADLVTRAVDMAIATLRKKLPVPVIETVVGVGYRWVS